MLRNTGLFLPSWFFGIIWVIVSTLGAILGLVVFAGLMAASGAGDEIAIILIPTVGGGILGMQWLILRQRIPHAAQWVLFTLAGGIMGAACLTIVSGGIGAILGSNPVTQYLQVTTIHIIALSLYGLGIGVAQWVFLRRYWASAGWWVLASLIGWAVLGLVVGSNLENLFELVWFGTIPSAATGFSLMCLLKEQQTLAVSEESQKAA